MKKYVVVWHEVGDGDGDYFEAHIVHAENHKEALEKHIKHIGFKEVENVNDPNIWRREDEETADEESKGQLWQSLFGYDGPVATIIELEDHEIS